MEWLIRCVNNLESGIYYASVDIHDREQPLMLLFKKEGEHTFVIGQGELINPHGRLKDGDTIKYETDV